MALLHVSINASDPENVATFLATVLGGEALPFQPFPGSWIAFAERDDGTAIEVYPLTHRLGMGPDAVTCERVPPDFSPTFVHIAVQCSLGRLDVLKLGRAQGWVTRICDRGPFECVECWLENRLLVEIHDAEMQMDYEQGMTMQQWRKMFRQD
jgi:hypothetical protein